MSMAQFGTLANDVVCVLVPKRTEMFPGVGCNAYSNLLNAVYANLI